MDTLELALDDLLAKTSLRSLRTLAKTAHADTLQAALAALRKREQFDDAQRLIAAFTEAHPDASRDAALPDGGPALMTTLAAAQALLVVCPSDRSAGARIHLLRKAGAPLVAKLPAAVVGATTSVWMERNLGRPVVSRVLQGFAKAKLVDLNVRQNSIGPAGAAAIAQLPHLTRLRLRPNSIGDGLRALASLQTLEWLEFAEAIEDVSFLAQLPKLRSLGMSHRTLGPRAAKVAAALPLRVLSMPLSGCGRKGAQLIATMSTLEALDLGGTPIGAAGAKALSKCHALRRLSLFSSKLDAEAVKQLSTMRALEHLNLADNPIGDKGAAALAGAQALTTLSVNDCRLTKVGLRAIGRLPQLTTLRADSDDFDDACAAALATGSAPLRHLSVEHGTLSPAGAAALARKTALVSLSITGNRVGDAGATSLSKLVRLRHLAIGATGVGEAGARAIASLSGLSALDIGGNVIGDRGITALGELKGLRELYIHLTDCSTTVVPALAKLTRLKRLSVRGNRISAAGLKALRAALPACEIEA